MYALFSLGLIGYSSLLAASPFNRFTGGRNSLGTSTSTGIGSKHLEDVPKWADSFCFVRINPWIAVRFISPSYLDPSPRHAGQQRSNIASIALGPGSCRGGMLMASVSVSSCPLIHVFRCHVSMFRANCRFCWGSKFPNLKDGVPSVRCGSQDLKSAPNTGRQKVFEAFCTFAGLSMS